MIQLIGIIHNTGGWILYNFVLFGLQPELEPDRLLLLSAVTTSVHMCVWAYVVYICVLRYKTIATHMIDDRVRH
jgi:hypothetical protein